MLIIYFFVLPYSSTGLAILFMSLFILQKQTKQYSIAFLIGFYFSNSFLLKNIFGLGIVLSIIHNVIIISLAYIMVTHFRVYGLTGQICSGKSSVSNYLKTHYGVSIISFDEMNKTVLEMPHVKLEIRKLFGDEVYIKENEGDHSNEIMDKAKIRKIVFENPDKKRKLEKITHLRVALMFFKMLFVEKLKNSNQIVVIENAILLRFFVLKLLCYKIISICVDDQNKLIERIMQRDKCDRVIAEDVIKNQMTIEQFRKESDIVIVNDGTESQLKDKVDKIFFEEILRQ